MNKKTINEVKSLKYELSFCTPEEVQCIADHFTGTHEQAIRELADKGDRVALACLIYCNVAKRPIFHAWTEEFFDEETGKTYLIDREEIEDYEEDTIFSMDKGNIEAYYEKILTECKHWATDELHKLIRLLESYDDQFHLQPIYRELANRNDAYGFMRLGDTFLHGCEKYGYYKDKDQSSKYYEKALELGADELFSEDIKDTLNSFDEYFKQPNDAEPCTYRYIIRGEQTQLDGIETMINQLCQLYGAPDNEMGMFVPFDELFRLMVGSKYYYGNIMQMERTPDALTLIFETEDGESNLLSYALRECFGEGLDIQIVEE